MHCLGLKVKAVECSIIINDIEELEILRAAIFWYWHDKAQELGDSKDKVNKIYSFLDKLLDDWKALKQNDTS